MPFPVADPLTQQDNPVFPEVPEAPYQKSFLAGLRQIMENIAQDNAVTGLQIRKR